MVNRLEAQWVSRTADSTSCDLSEGEVVLWKEEDERQSERRKRRKWMQHQLRNSSLLSAYTLLSTHAITHSITTRYRHIT